MNAGRVLEFLYLLAFWFFIISVFVLPVAFAYWRRNEQLRAEATEEALESLGFDTSHLHEQDAWN